MALFNLFGKSQSPNLDHFKAALFSYKNAASYSEKLNACDNLISIIPTIRESDIVFAFKTEGKKDRNYYSHPELGILWNRERYLSSLLDSVQRDRDRTLYLFNKSEEYRKQLDAIPVADVLIDPDSSPLSRNSLSDMPEVKYSTITKSFNRDKLPAFVVIDTETDGLQVRGGRIIELSAIRYEDFQPVLAWSTLINPGKHIPKEATAVNCITDEMVADAPSLYQVSNSFISFVGPSPVIGYNLPFDLKFLFSRGIDLTSSKRKFFDVLELSRKAYKNDLDSFSLKDVSELCRIYPHIEHRSLSDCYSTALVFQNCIEDITGV